MTKDNIDLELDNLFNAIEKMIDIQDVISYEEQHENRAAAYDIKVKHHTPAKKEAQQAFQSAVKEIVRKMFKNRTPYHL
jgi:HEPN domain-containing protein